MAPAINLSLIRLTAADEMVAINRMYHLAYYYRHREKRCAANRDYHHRNKEKMVTRSKRYRAANREKVLEKARRWQRIKALEPGHSEVVRGRNLRRVYGISTADYDAMFLAQKGLCAICARSPEHVSKRRLAVDHNHVTGQLRQLLCAACNTMIGLAHESAERLMSAASYLKRHQKEL